MIPVCEVEADDDIVRCCKCRKELSAAYIREGKIYCGRHAPAIGRNS